MRPESQGRAAGPSRGQGRDGFWTVRPPPQVAFASHPTSSTAISSFLPFPHQLPLDAEVTVRWEPVRHLCCVLPVYTQQMASSPSYG